VAFSDLAIARSRSKPAAAYLWCTRLRDTCAAPKQVQWPETATAGCRTPMRSMQRGAEVNRVTRQDGRATALGPTGHGFA
jgi:hypothetical protein